MADHNKMIWPGWETVRRIGKGGFGAVYEIQRDVLGETEKAALKVITIPQDDSDLDGFYSDGFDHDSIADTFKSHLKNILAEYSLMRKMNGSSHIVSCDDVRFIQHDDGIGWDIFIKMELLTPLTAAVPMEVPEDVVVKVARDMCAALELCKKYEIVHRDIKPQNIFLSPNGDYKLGDFGIARTMEKTMGATKIGTFDYMAPEVYNNRPYGTSADIYSLGLVLYWMLNDRRLPFLPISTGMPTFEEKEVARLRRFAGEAIPVPRRGSKALQKIVLKACAYDPKDRYQSAREMLEDLNGLQYAAPVVITEIRIPDPPKSEESEPDDKTEALFYPHNGGKTEEQKKDNQASVPVQEFGSRHLTEKVLEGEPRAAGNPTGHKPHFEKEEETYYLPGPADKKKTDPKPKKTGLIVAVVCLVIIAVLAVCYFTVHSWSVVSCTEPATCKICGKIREAAPGHQWTDASCRESRTCLACGQTEGTALGHQWEEATCLEPESCRICGEFRGEAQNHEWQLSEEILQYVCTQCGESANTIRICYDVNFPAEAVAEVDQVPAIQEGIPTDFIMTGDAVVIRTLTSRTARNEISTSNRQSISYYFSGWNVVGTEMILQPDSAFDWSDLETWADEHGTIYLMGVWENASRYNSVSFFVRFDSSAVDTNGNISSQSKEHYTPEIFNAHVGGVDTSMTDNAIRKAYEIADTTADDSIGADQAIRELCGQKDEGVWLSDMPSDEEVLAYLRTYLAENPGKCIMVDGERIDPEELDADHFAILWYVFKLEDVTWHIDGKLVKK